MSKNWKRFLSLGSAVQGWTYDGSYQTILNNLSDKAKNANMVVTISAGNSYALTQFHRRGHEHDRWIL